MGYSVMFYAVDVDRLRAIHGSGDESFLQEVLTAQAEELDGNDAFFDGYDLPLDSREALRRIVAGNVPVDETESAAMYGYVLKIVCEHLGEPAGGDLYNARILPIESKLMTNGSPIPIPDDPGDFPEIGHLTREGIAEERRAVANALPPSSPHFFDNVREFTHHTLEADDLLEELDVYREILDDLAGTGLGTVAFRH